MTTESRKPTKRRRGGRRRRPRAPAPLPEAAASETPPPLDDLAPEPSQGPLPLAEPELAFAARAAARPPEPERPLPTTRRAIFFDVENTSRVQHISRVIDHLAVDRLGRRTDFIAVGNWRVIGAQLLHSAPSVGVKDWSDLRIAVAAGVWLGTARPGDALEIISDDRAFDAVGDVATSLGITFRRLSYRRLTGLPTPAPISAVVEPQPQAPAEPSQGGGRRRRGRRGGRRHAGPPVHHAPAPAAPAAGVEPHSAPHDELLGVARDLIQRSPGATVTLDSLANALKARGFSRPAGSPRLITRLRRIRELSVSRSGQITLVEGGQALAPEETPAPSIRASASEPDDRREDGEDERTFEARRAQVEALQRQEPVGAPAAHASAPADGQRRRRSRRGGRRHRRHGAPAG